MPVPGITVSMLQARATHAPERAVAGTRTRWSDVPSNRAAIWRNRETDKGDRSAECSHHGCHKARTDKYMNTGGRDIYSQVGSIFLSEKQGIQRLDQQQGPDQTYDGCSGKEWQLCN